ncbi:unnamed protein product [Mytilus coruscus]|uniref:Reverse transcriptase domain-containing protein n=1 Tax=Mytilus coruscus TaxID=42192 RepID=A0A6J8CRF2_MYTCO|nr:unnamed protein product [Mytilus coruscus]
MNAMTEALPSNHTNNILIAKAVVDPSCGQIPVRMANITEFEQTIQPDTHVAICEAVEVNIDSNETNIDKLSKVSSVEESKETPSHLKDLKMRSSELLNEDQIKLLNNLLIKYDQTFSKNKSDLGRASAIKHTISTGQAKPIKQAPRRLPLSNRDEVNDEIQRLLDYGVIEPSKSLWASCIVPATKKSDGSTRICIDFRPLNNITVHDSYPFIRIDDALDALRGCKWLSVMDLSSGYWQVEMDEKDTEKTAFTSTKGLFHFNIMPMGLCNGVATFQRLMEYTLAGLNWQTCLIYIDDIIVFSYSFESHLIRLGDVLDRIAAQGLKVAPKKCLFFQNKVSFLGHIVSKEGIAADPGKIESRDWDEQLPWALMAYRSSEHETTKLSPCMLMLGREIELPIDLIYGPHPQRDEFPTDTEAANSYVHNLETLMLKIQQKAPSLRYRMHRHLTAVHGLNKMDITEVTIPTLMGGQRAPIKDKQKTNLVSETVEKPVESQTEPSREVAHTNYARTRESSGCNSKKVEVSDKEANTPPFYNAWSIGEKCVDTSDLFSPQSPTTEVTKPETCIPEGTLIDLTISDEEDSASDTSSNFSETDTAESDESKVETVRVVIKCGDSGI